MVAPTCPRERRDRLQETVLARCGASNDQGQRHVSDDDQEGRICSSPGRSAFRACIPIARAPAARSTFWSTYGAPTQAGSRCSSRLVRAFAAGSRRAEPVLHLQPWLGYVVQFPLDTPLAVKPGEVVGLTVPTSAPVLDRSSDEELRLPPEPLGQLPERGRQLAGAGHDRRRHALRVRHPGTRLETARPRSRRRQRPRISFIRGGRGGGRLRPARGSGSRPRGREGGPALRCRGTGRDADRPALRSARRGARRGPAGSEVPGAGRHAGARNLSPPPAICARGT